MELDGMKFRGLDDQGNETECEVLHAFDCAETGKSYLVYTDGATDEKGRLRYFAAAYSAEGEGLSLDPVESPEEWEIIDRELYAGDSSAD